MKLMNVLKTVVVGISLVALIGIAGCACNDCKTKTKCSDNKCELTEATNPLGEYHKMHDAYTFMVDNAMLEDMNVSSVHFVPNHAELNALGVKRLTRMAQILDVYGGTVVYDGRDRSDTIRQARLDEIRRFLGETGIDADRFDVAAGVAMGEGMNGEEALQVRVAARFDESEATGDLPAMATK